MFKLYSFLYLLGFLIYLPREFLKRKEKDPLRWLKEKLGLIEPPSFQERRPVIWIHAVSVGEVLALSSLVEKMAKSYNLVLTTITDTGREVAKKRFFHLPVKIYYLPLDLKRPLLNFLKRTEAKALLVAETEIWPNLIKVVSEKIPVALINGRISQKSFKRYKLLHFFFKPLLNSFRFLAVQEEIYGERLREIGVEPKKIKVVGNLKFDLFIPEREFVELEVLPRPIIIAGSTHPPEEELILRSFLETVEKGTLILVPRHPERFKEVEEIILKNLSDKEEFFRYSEWEKMAKTITKKRVLLLFDKMGVLSSLYQICNLAIVGGSFIPHGGQNPLEPIYWKKPVITGPYMENFPFVKDFVREGALLQVSPENLSKALKRLLENENLAHLMAEKAYLIYQNKKGALEKTLALIEELLN